LTQKLANTHEMVRLEKTDMKTIEVLTEATSLKDLVSLAKRETEVVLTEHETPVARVVPIPSPPPASSANHGRRLLGLHPGAWEISDDFDQPLPDEFWLGKA
jgi:antitoxin (DNA-binding transcriptional repressor) of toxin-antitoxin stability system